MSANGRWILLTIVVVAVAAVFYFGLSNDKSDPTAHVTTEANKVSKPDFEQHLGGAGGAETVKSSQLPRMLELGSVG